MCDVPFVLVLPKIKALMHPFSVHLPVRQDNGAPDKVFLQLPHIHSGAGAKVGEVAGAGAEVGEVGEWAGWSLVVGAEVGEVLVVGAKVGEVGDLRERAGRVLVVGEVGVA